MTINQLIPEFRLADAQAYLNAYPFEELKYQSFFPEQYTSDLTFQSIEANTGAKVAAPVVAFNSRAPRMGRPTPGKISGDMPKIEVARDKVETDFNQYRKLISNLRAVGPTGQADVKRRIIEWIYDDQPFVVDGVRARLEWLAKRAASNGAYDLTLVNNEQGVQTTVNVDFGIPGSNKVNASVSWNDHVNADPVADFKAIKQNAKNKGKVIRFATMDEATFDNMVACAKFQKYCAGYIANALQLVGEPSLEQANAALRGKGLPQIRIWESDVTIEKKDGSQDIDSGWEPGRVCFTATEQIGSVQYTLSADEFVEQTQGQKTKSGIVLVKTWAEEDPITVITKGVAYATPVLGSYSGTFLLSTVPATT